MWQHLRNLTAGALVCAGLFWCAPAVHAQYRQNFYHHHHQNRHWQPNVIRAGVYSAPLVYPPINPYYQTGPVYPVNPYYAGQTWQQPYVPYVGNAYYPPGPTFGLGVRTGNFSFFLGR